VGEKQKAKPSSNLKDSLKLHGIVGVNIRSKKLKD